MTTINTRSMVPGDLAAWDRFVASTSGGTFFHLSPWIKVLAESFSLKPHFLVAESRSEIIGVLPLFHQKNWLFGNALIAAPFLVEGGPLTSNSDARQALDDAALNLKRITGAAYLEYRSRVANRQNWQSRKGLYATFKRGISVDENANLLAIPRKQRAVLRKALGSGLVSEVDKTIDRFYPIYSESVRNLGTPVFPRSYFDLLLKAFGQSCDITVVLDKGRAVSAVLNFYFKDTVLPYYGGGTPDARLTGANDFLYWEVMRRAAQRGYTQFDFGRSKAGTGAFKFKTNWGFEPEWLEYEYYLDEGATLPDKNPNNPRYKLLIAAWKKLPLPLANFVGPFLISGLA